VYSVCVLQVGPCIQNSGYPGANAEPVLDLLTLFQSVIHLNMIPITVVRSYVVKIDVLICITFMRDRCCPSLYHNLQIKSTKRPLLHQIDMTLLP
jgi:hypothetical protein